MSRAKKKPRGMSKDELQSALEVLMDRLDKQMTEARQQYDQDMEELLSLGTNAGMKMDCMSQAFEDAVEAHNKRVGTSSTLPHFQNNTVH